MVGLTVTLACDFGMGALATSKVFLAAGGPAASARGHRMGVFRGGHLTAQLPCAFTLLSFSLPVVLSVLRLLHATVTLISTRPAQRLKSVGEVMAP